MIKCRNNECNKCCYKCNNNCEKPVCDNKDKQFDYKNCFFYLDTENIKFAKV